MGIKHQLRITTLMPVLLVAVLFAIFYNIQFERDFKQHISRLGETYIHQILPTAKLAFLHDDQSILKDLIDIAILNPEVQAVSLYNSTGQLLAYGGSKHDLSNLFNAPLLSKNSIETRQIDSKIINFLAPISISKFNFTSLNTLSSVPMATLLENDILGWLSIDVDTSSMLIQRYIMYIIIIFIILFGLILSLTIHYFLSKRISVPIKRLSHSMKQILSNEFETKIPSGSKAELGTIEQACIHLQTQYLNTITDLNHHIEVSTSDLQQSLELLEEKNIELSLDKKKTEEQSRIKSELFINMSHEIRTPMHGVIGFANLLLEGKLDPLQMDYVQTIKSSAQDLLTTINDILDYSKMDAGKLHLDCIPVDIRVCIDEVITLMMPSAHKKNLDLIPATALNVPKIMLGDPLRLKQMLTNLISNAIKFTEHGYVLIRTTILEESEKDYTVTISITDTGIGISSEDQSTLFNAFNQADTSITRRFGGSGLGLVICKKLAEHMQGKISLTSELHKGSTFTIQIKLEKLSAYEIEKKQIHRFANLKVICFDDNPLHLEAICNGLGFWGIHCVRVNSFRKLNKTFKLHKDCHLAFINVNEGCEQQVATVVAKQTIPCILISKWQISDYQALGAKGFLFKPTTMQKLHDAVSTFLNDLDTNKHNKVSTLGKGKTKIPTIVNLRKELASYQPKLLIAEDNKVNRMFFTSILEDNAKIETVNDGKQAVNIANKYQFHAILLDLQMPILTGLEAAYKIRQSPGMNKKTPIILISAGECLVSTAELKKAGFSWLPKPINEEKLLTELLRIISKPKAIHWDLCVQKVSGNQDLAANFLVNFVNELVRNREEFLLLMEQKNIKKLGEVAHKLHGACCFCGVPELQNNVIAFENLTKQVDHADELTTIFTELIHSIDAVIKEFNLNYNNLVNA